MPRLELIELAASKSQLTREELSRIALGFVASKELYVTCKELADLFASIFLYYGFTETIE